MRSLYTAALVALPLLLLAPDVWSSDRYTVTLAPGATPAQATATVQALINSVPAGSIIHFPAGSYTLAQAPSSATWCLLINKSLTIEGEGISSTKLILDPGEADDVDTVWMLRVSGVVGFTLRDIDVSGSKPGSGTVTAYDGLIEHHQGLSLINSSGITITRVNFHDHTGDGVNLNANVTDVLVDDVDFQYNQRDGISLAPPDMLALIPPQPPTPVARVTIRNSRFVGITSQPIDNEHGPAYDVEVYGNTISAGLNDYVVAVGGPIDREGSYSERWSIHDNVLNGPVLVTRGKHVTIRDNLDGINGTKKPCLEVWRTSSDVLYTHNNCRLTQLSTVSVGGVGIFGTTGEYPYDIRIVENKIQVDHPKGFGVRVDGAISVEVRGNTLIGGATSLQVGYAGVYLRATTTEVDFESATVIGNSITGFGQYGVAIFGNGAARMLNATIAGNNVFNPAPGGPLRTAVSLDDGTGALRAGTIYGNVTGCGLTAGVTGVPTGPGGVNNSFTFGTVAVTGSCPQ